MSVWGGLHISPRGAPSKGVKLGTYLQWFARPDRISTEPYYELPPSGDKAQIHFPFSAASTVLIPCRLSRAGLGCLRCHGICAGAHFVQAMLSVMSAIVCLIALIFRAFGSSMQMIFRDSHDAMRSVMWHKDQKSVCALVLAIVNEAQTL